MSAENAASPAPGQAKEALPPGSVPIIISLLVAAFVMILNETLIGIALPRLAPDLGISVNTAQWAATSFMLTMAVVIPTTGFLLQRVPTRTLYTLAMSAFLAGTIIAGIAPNFIVLIIGRVVQASGTAMIMPLFMTTILTLVPLSRRGAMMGNLSLVISVAPAMGPFFSGLIVNSLGWRWLFYLVIPVAVIAFAVGLKYLTNVGEIGDKKIDIISVLLTVPAFGGFVFGISQLGGESGGTDKTLAIAALAVGVIGLVLFSLRQLKLQKVDDALLDLRVFTFRPFTIGLAVMVLTSIAMFGAIFLLPVYMLQILGFESDLAGFLLLPGGLAMGLAAPWVGRLFDRVGPRPLIVTGALAVVAGYLVFANLGNRPEPWMIAVLVIFINLGLSLIFTPAMTSALNSLSMNLYSHGSAVLSTLQQVGGAVGTALMFTIFSAVGLATGSQMAAIQTVFYVTAALGLLVAFAGFFTRKFIPVPIAHTEPGEPVPVAGQ